jgi:hypothetical protein
MSALDHQLPPDWEAFQAARDRFFNRVRPEALAQPPASPCPDTPPLEWPRAPERDDPESPAGAAEPTGNVTLP